jgi:hypothetical protein
VSIRELIEQLEAVAKITGDGAPVSCPFAIESVTNHAGTARVNLGAPKGVTLEVVMALSDAVDDAQNCIEAIGIKVKDLRKGIFNRE